ncbi:MAG: hypothetical protein HQK53_14405 [Oligoflexia bacterium]|nr:hypothetical protein [Oligoflexia bacterium]
MSFKIDGNQKLCFGPSIIFAIFMLILFSKSELAYCSQAATVLTGTDQILIDQQLSDRLNVNMQRVMKWYSENDPEMAVILRSRAATTKEGLRFGDSALYDRGYGHRGMRASLFISDLLSDQKRHIELQLKEVLENPQNSIKYRGFDLLCDIVRNDKLDDIFAHMGVPNFVGIIPQLGHNWHGNMNSSNSHLITQISPYDFARIREFTMMIHDWGKQYRDSFHKRFGDGGDIFVPICLPSIYFSSTSSTSSAGVLSSSALLYGLDAVPSMNELIQHLHLTYNQINLYLDNLLPPITTVDAMGYPIGYPALVIPLSETRPSSISDPTVYYVSFDLSQRKKVVIPLEIREGLQRRRMVATDLDAPTMKESYPGLYRCINMTLGKNPSFIAMVSKKSCARELDLYKFIADHTFTQTPISSSASFSMGGPESSTGIAIEEVIDFNDLPNCASEVVVEGIATQEENHLCLMKDIVGRLVGGLITRSLSFVASSSGGISHGMLIKHRILLTALKDALNLMKNTNSHSFRSDPTTISNLYGWIFDLTSGILAASVPQLYDSNEFSQIIADIFRYRFPNMPVLVPQESYLTNSGMHALYSAIKGCGVNGSTPVALTFGNDYREWFANRTNRTNRTNHTNRRSTIIGQPAAVTPVLEDRAYYELGSFLEVTAPVNSTLQINRNTDSFLVGLTPNTIFQRKKLDSILHIVKECAAHKSDEGFCTLIVDDTIELPTENPVDVLLTALIPEISQGKIIIIVAKSLQKFTSLGVPKVRSGFVSFINKVDPKFNQLIRSIKENVGVGERDFVTEQTTMHVLSTNVAGGSGIRNDLKLNHFSAENASIASNIYTQAYSQMNSTGQFAPLLNGSFLFFGQDPENNNAQFILAPDQLQVSRGDSFGFLTSSAVTIPSDATRIYVGIESPYTIYEKYYSNAFFTSMLGWLKEHKEQKQKQGQGQGQSQSDTALNFSSKVFLNKMLGIMENGCALLKDKDQDPYVTAKMSSMTKELFIIVDRFSTLMPLCSSGKLLGSKCKAFFRSLFGRSKRIFMACQPSPQQLSFSGNISRDAQVYYDGMTKISTIIAEEEEKEARDGEQAAFNITVELYSKIQAATANRWSILNSALMNMLEEEGSSGVRPTSITYENVRDYSWIFAPFFHTVLSELMPPLPVQLPFQF